MRCVAHTSTKHPRSQTTERPVGDSSFRCETAEVWFAVARVAISSSCSIASHTVLFRQHARAKSFAVRLQNLFASHRSSVFVVVPRSDLRPGLAIVVVRNRSGRRWSDCCYDQRLTHHAFNESAVVEIARLERLRSALSTVLRRHHFGRLRRHDRSKSRRGLQFLCGASRANTKTHGPRFWQGPCVIWLCDSSE